MLTSSDTTDPTTPEELRVAPAGARPPQRAADPTMVIADPVEVASRLRYSAFRLARLLRQQDDSGFAPAILSALAIIDREGPLTLGALAAQEQVSPPTITKVVDALVAREFVERIPDENDRRVCRVRATARGRRQLEASRTRRTAWLANQLRDLDAEELARLAGALEVIEQLTKPPGWVTP